MEVVGVADEGEAGLAELDGVAVVEQVAHGVADEGEVLVAVGADELAPGLAVEDEALVGGNLDIAEAEADVGGIGEGAIGGDGLDAEEVEGGGVGGPLGGLVDGEGLGDLLAFVEAADGALAVKGDAGGDLPLALGEALGGEVDAALRAGDGEGDGAGLNQPDVAVDAAEVGEVELFLHLTGGVVLVVGVVALHAQDVAGGLELAGDLDVDGVVATEALAHLLAIEEDLALAHDGLEVEELARTLLGPVEALFVGGGALVVGAAAGLEADDVEGVGEVHAGLIAIAADEVPAGIEGGDGARGVFCGEVTGLRETRKIGVEGQREECEEGREQTSHGETLLRGGWCGGLLEDGEIGGLEAGLGDNEDFDGARGGGGKAPVRGLLRLPDREDGAPIHTDDDGDTRREGEVERFLQGADVVALAAVVGAERRRSARRERKQIRQEGPLQGPEGDGVCEVGHPVALFEETFEVAEHGVGARVVQHGIRRRGRFQWALMADAGENREDGDGIVLGRRGKADDVRQGGNPVIRADGVRVVVPRPEDIAPRDDERELDVALGRQEEERIGFQQGGEGGLEVLRGSLLNQDDTERVKVQPLFDARLVTETDHGSDTLAGVFPGEPADVAKTIICGLENGQSAAGMEIRGGERCVWQGDAFGLGQSEGFGIGLGGRGGQRRQEDDVRPADIQVLPAQLKDVGVALRGGASRQCGKKHRKDGRERVAHQS